MTFFHDHNMSPPPSAVIFDLDGTLVDSARDLTAALNHVLRRESRPGIDISQVRNMVGDGARALIIKGFSASGAVPDAAALDAMQRDFLAHYEGNMGGADILFPGVRKVIAELHRREIPLGICTNKVHMLTKKLIGNVGLADYFTALAGGDSFAWRKPDPRHLLSTLDLMGAPRERAVMVGDSANDIIPARKAGLAVIGVSFGYTKTPMSELAPDEIIDDFAEFFPALNRISRKFAS